MMSPAEIGAGAGYEAYRNFMHLNSEFFAPEDYRQREAIVGLAVAEGSFVLAQLSLILKRTTATRLWQSTGRQMDRVGLQAACEAAGGTASIIVGQWIENEPGRSPYMSAGTLIGGPAMSAIGTPSMVGSTLGADPYAYDDDLYRRGRRRRRRERERRASSVGPTIINVGGGAGPQPFPGQYPSTMATGMGIPGSTMAGTIPLSSSPYAGGMAMPASYGAGSTIGAGGLGTAYNTGVPVQGTGYANSMGGLGIGGLGTSQMIGGAHLGGSLANPMPQALQPAYQASMAAAYPSALPNIGGVVPGQGMAGMGAYNAPLMSGGTTTIIPPPVSGHRHRHHHHRSRSRERDYEREIDREERREARRMRRYSDAAAYGGIAGSYVGAPASAYGGRY